MKTSYLMFVVLSQGDQDHSAVTAPKIPSIENSFLYKASTPSPATGVIFLKSSSYYGHSVGD